MSDSRAFTYQIKANGSSPEEDGAVHQSSPSWVLTFISWQYRDTLRLDKSQGSAQTNSDSVKLKSVKDPLIVVNDCISVSTTSNKGSYTPNMEATLVQTDTNYLTAIAPGDFVIVNMLNWEKDAEDVAKRAKVLKPINGFKDGFKGIFKVQSVRRIVSVGPNGAKIVRFKITGFAFTEFNNSIYFDPSVVLQEGDLIFANRLAENWYNLINENKAVPVQSIIRLLSETFIGKGLSDNIPRSEISLTDVLNNNSSNSTFENKLSNNSAILNIHDSQNTMFFMPMEIGKLLNIPGVTTAKDIYNFILGIQNYGNINSSSVHLGFNPTGLINTSGRTYEMPSGYECPGVSLLKSEYWNQVKTWDILNQYTNKPINEFFTCFRIDPKRDYVIPTVVFRQTPFTTEDFVLNGDNVNPNAKVTKFLNLPRWTIDSAMVLNEDIGRDEAARINYVQVFGRTLQGTDNGSDFTMETIRKNYVFEKNDIQRSGLRPTVISSMFDIFSEGSAVAFNSITWSRILGDAMIGAHLRLNGHLSCVGIVDPIPVGDNFEYDGIVYHIEQVSNTCAIDTNSGIKSFRTLLSLSQGISVTSSQQYGTIYAQMKNPNAYAERIKDYNNNAILPGVSESQDLPNRTDLDKSIPFKNPNNGFPQPKEIKLFPDKSKKVK